MNVHRIGAHSLAMLLVGACATQATPPASMTVDTLPDGAVHVVNLAPSRWADTSGWRLVLEHTIAPPAGGTPLLAQPYSLAVDSNGDVFESDWKVGGVQEFDSSGKYIRTLGRTGDGPREFRGPIDLAVHGNTLAAIAGNQLRVSLWSTRGTLLTSWHLPNCCWWDPMLGDSGTLRLATTISGHPNPQPIVVRWRPDGTPIDTMFLPPEPGYPGWRDSTGGVFSIPFTPYVESTFDSRRRYVSGYAVHYTLVVSRTGRDTARIIDLPGARAAIPDSVADSLFARSAMNRRIGNIVKRSDIPSEQPYFTALFADDDDNIWIARPDGMGATAAFDVVDSSGRYLGAVPLPDHHLRVMRFTRDRMYAFGENDDGEPVIGIYHIDRPRK